MKERPFGDIKKFRKKFLNFQKTINENFNSLIVPENVKGGPLGFFNIHSVAKHQKIEGGPFEDFKKIRKKSQSRKRGGESVIPPKNWKGPFWVLHFKV